jgi:hypothetical protein
MTLSSGTFSHGQVADVQIGVGSLAGGLEAGDAAKEAFDNDVEVEHEGIVPDIVFVQLDDCLSGQPVRPCDLG